MTIEHILSALGLIGIGSIISAIVSYFIGGKKKKSDAKQELKEERYKAVLLLCYAFVYYEREHTTLIINRPNINSKDLLLNELTAEWVNMSLYASDNVILRMKSLIEEQTVVAYNTLIVEMRKDLYSVKTVLTADSFRLSNSDLISQS